MPDRWFVSAVFLAGAASLAQAQPSADLQQVLERLGRLEMQNRELMTESRSLRQHRDSAKPPPENPPAAAAEASAAIPAESTPPAAPLDERVAVAEDRIAQQDQEKNSSEHKLPITLTGMLLFNSFWTGRGGGNAQNPTIAPLTAGPVDAGATFRQSVVGIKFDGPDIAGGGKITGSAYVDFFGGSGAT